MTPIRPSRRIKCACLRETCYGRRSLLGRSLSTSAGSSRPTKNGKWRMHSDSSVSNDTAKLLRALSSDRATRLPTIPVALQFVVISDCRAEVLEPKRAKRVASRDVCDLARDGVPQYP